MLFDTTALAESLISFRIVYSKSCLGAANFYIPKLTENLSSFYKNDEKKCSVLDEIILAKVIN